ncbi:MAG: disulfide bond formation protein B [Burkholderiaceae bacterium]
MRLEIRLPRVLAAVAALALGAVGAAVVAQYAFDMQPCPWCVLQRFIYLVVAALALAGALAGGAVRRVAAGLGALAALSGIAAAAWQQFVGVSENSCDLSLAERITTGLHLDRLLPQLFIAYASCADAAVDLLHVPFAVWSGLLFGLLAMLLLWVARAAMAPAGQDRDGERTHRKAAP